MNSRIVYDHHVNSLLPSHERYIARRNPQRSCLWELKHRFDDADPANALLEEYKEDFAKDLLVQRLREIHLREVELNDVQGELKNMPESSTEASKIPTQCAKEGEKKGEDGAPAIRLRGTQMRVVWKSDKPSHSEKLEKQKMYESLAEKRQQEEDNEFFGMISRATKIMKYD
ncbi:MdlA [Perkinsela sp. CCAP 1560/4]|nr:MdlA [Perkinsela sp. CCAP 1560/4]|eukprot:KNH06535.1 MdlA [Perkinsela sp. CCAP 1560/4]